MYNPGVKKLTRTPLLLGDAKRSAQGRSTAKKRRNSPFTPVETDVDIPLAGSSIGMATTLKPRSVGGIIKHS